MPWSILDIPLALPTFALVLFRISGLMVTAPIFSSKGIPLRVRAAFTLVLAAMIFPLVKNEAPSDLTLVTALTAGVAEFMIGAVIGLALTLVLMTALVAGTMVGQQAGLALSQAVNPLEDLRTTVVGQIYYTILSLLFLLAGGHRAALAALLDTYKAIPLLSYQPDESMVLLLIEILTAAFIVGVRVAGPVIIALFLTETSMGFVSRTMPQMNILAVGFSIRAFVALGVAALSLSASEGILLDALWDGLDMIRMSFGLVGIPSG